MIEDGGIDGITGRPDTNEVLGIDEIVTRARQAQRSWAATALGDRLAILRKARIYLALRARSLAEMIARTGPRSPGEALVTEILPLADAGKFLERRAPRLLAPRRLGARGRPAWLFGVRAEIRREPLGLVLVLAPYNYPLFLPGVQILQALAAGNAVIAKPAAEGGPVLSTLAEILDNAGLPEGLLAVLDDSVEAGEDAVRAHPDKVVLTGSARTGRRVASALAESLIPATMELSGNDAVFILPGADLDLAAAAVAYGLGLNGGATCIAPRRVFVPREAAADFEARLAPMIDRMPAAPLSASVRDRLMPLLDEAGAAGCRLVPERPEDSAEAMRPLAVFDADPALGLLKADIFAPVVSVVAVDDDEAALQADEACPYALGASVFGPETAARALAGRIDAGAVTVNDLIVPTADPRLPFGGRGESGHGVTRGAEGLLEMTRIKTVSVRRGRFRPYYDPVRPGDEALFASYGRAAHGGEWRTRLVGLQDMVRLIRRRGR